jgi:hypothetical protein
LADRHRRHCLRFAVQRRDHTVVTQGLKQNGDSAVLKAFLAVPIVVGIVALALITGGIIFLVRYLKKYPRRGKQDEQNSSSV